MYPRLGSGRPSAPGSVSPQRDLSAAGGDPSLAGLVMPLLSGGRRTLAGSDGHVRFLSNGRDATPGNNITARGDPGIGVARHARGDSGRLRALSVRSTDRWPTIRTRRL